MRAARAPSDFLLPDSAGGQAPTDGLPPCPVTRTQYVVLDQSGEVRGGFVLLTQPGWLNGARLSVANYQSPLSEGIHDSRFGMVALHMLKHVQRHFPYVFVVGMGHPDRPLPRLLSAAGWNVTAVPFLFHVVRPGRVLRELPILRQQGWLNLAARAAALSGSGWLSMRVMQYRSAFSRSRLSIAPIDKWGSWTDEIWNRARDASVFSVARDAATLDALYPLHDRRHLAIVVRDGGETVGWAVCLNTSMRDHQHFGNLRVATVLDACGLRSRAPSLAASIRDFLVDDGADLIVANFTHGQWIDAFRRAGFLQSRSNYLLATSKPLAEATGCQHRRIHVTRGDGDGRIHL